MTREQAEELLIQTAWFDYLSGRVMKIDLSKDELDPSLYDRDNGDGAAAQVIETLRNTGETVSEQAKIAHKIGVLSSAEQVKKGLEEETHRETKGNFEIVHLGLKDQASVLRPAVDAAIANHTNKEGDSR
jgi:hypothetical protein